MRPITFLTPDDRTYVSPSPSSPQDVAVPAKPTPEHVFDRATLAWVLPLPTLEEAKAAKLAEVMSAYQTAFAPLEAAYPAAEREGWPRQEAEARAVLADPKAHTPLLSTLVEMRGKHERVTDLAAKILANATAWATAYAVLTGQQQRMCAEVAALDTVEAVQAYSVEYRMPE